MLTPVRAASNASFSLQAQRAAISTDGIVHSAAAVVPAQPIEGGDLNSAIAGKLNVLLLAVRVRMVEALLDVLDSSGDALAAPRGEDETPLAFASRLADAIEKLPPAKIEAVERQLAAQGQAIPLRLLAEALKNPAGPEAARIAAYLEATRSKDRDLATRAVVRSYGQNDGSPLRPEQRAEIDIQRGNLWQTARPVPPRVDGNEPKASVDKPAANIATTSAAAAYAETTVAEQTAMPVKPVTSAQQGLTENAGPARGGVEAQETDQAEFMLPAPVADAENTDQVQPRLAAGDPIIPKTWPAIPASMTDEKADLIVAIIRDQEAEVLLEAVDTDAPLEDTTAGDVQELPAARLPEAAVPREGIAKQAAVLAQQPAQPTEAAALEAAKRQAVTPEPAHAAAKEMIDSTYLPVMMKVVEGVPYAPAPYQFAKDEAEDTGSREMYREDHDSGSEGDEEEQAEPQGEEATVLAAEERAPPEPNIAASEIAAPAPSNHLLLPAPGPAMQPIPDEAYARYRRLVGWE
ncbi:hypothetical protein QTL95_13195 [Rhizobium sp. S152]|uniref:hypothetical protein n=1 Tax=Rhizobium sp. S152 TaxID=3055038 RepID=UPI0025A9F4FF|nr:hypothetical protein [Rhizobium sp. S152]MDM9626857.1 hypothetical protein [Rhizobium sp. S152]